MIDLQEMKFLRFFTFAIAVVSGVPLEDRRVECKNKFNVELENIFFKEDDNLFITIDGSQI